MTDYDTNHDLLALVDLISCAVKDVIKEYGSVGQSVPALDSVVTGPFDSQETTNLAITKAVRVIEGACAQLCATVAWPAHAMENKAEAGFTGACLRIAADAKISDYLLDKPAGLHVSELSQKCGIESGRLARTLRLLASQHCYREVTPDVFANNRLSMKLVTKDPVSAYLQLTTNEGLKSVAYLYEAFKDPVYGGSYDIDKAPFSRVFGMPLFTWIENTKNEHGEPMTETFAKCMEGLGDINNRGIVAKVFPWSTLPVDTVICDVAGGSGHVSMLLLRQFPQIKAIIQDQPSVVKVAREYWKAKFPKAIEEDRISFEPINFFTESPVPGCDYYYVRQILHDWPDAECLNILGNIRRVMKPSSRLLIHEYICPPQDWTTEHTTVERAPKPLLPNYGFGSSMVYGQDLRMLLTLNAKERSVQDFADLGKQAGLKLIKAYDTGSTGLVELALA
ncbi:S-adenosyl-L-methionine-dependent methyltransferase [Neolentinus lepideus HHB14362 ss-1]|uniref:S-adenosyl-L-methionine-dependent methyltransferase n=1 Tax=Neolentinus lepideus HHB14362 ss-1 TaxID=1314782 RepID=A0A165VGE2_9AGAM|nr:S-adenosyl-L-methionine-dependent methyltransferase [Neolentinus lepideus HHB14362 ss-1]